MVIRDGNDFLQSDLRLLEHFFKTIAGIPSGSTTSFIFKLVSRCFKNSAISKVIIFFLEITCGITVTG